MNIEELREYCLSVRGAEESFPFDETTLVFKIVGKMFAFTGLDAADGRFVVCLKCDPDRSVLLRERYTGVGRSHYGGQTLLWNGVALDSDVPDELIRELIDHSVEEVLKKLPKKIREAYWAEK
jgi:predicted DNA-binding protein (MmcQ/YjbR family)